MYYAIIMFTILAINNNTHLTVVNGIVETKFVLQSLQDYVECQIIVICLSRYDFECICTFLCMTNNCVHIYIYICLFNVYKVGVCVCVF